MASEQRMSEAVKGQSQISISAVYSRLTQTGEGRLKEFLNLARTAANWLLLPLPPCPIWKEIALRYKNRGRTLVKGKHGSRFSGLCRWQRISF